MIWRMSSGQWQPSYHTPDRNGQVRPYLCHHNTQPPLSSLKLNKVLHLKILRRVDLRQLVQSRLLQTMPPGAFQIWIRGKEPLCRGNINQPPLLLLRNHPGLCIQTVEVTRDSSVGTHLGVKRTTLRIPAPECIRGSVGPILKPSPTRQPGSVGKEGKINGDSMPAPARIRLTFQQTSIQLHGPTTCTGWRLIPARHTQVTLQHLEACMDTLRDRPLQFQ